MDVGRRPPMIGYTSFQRWQATLLPSPSACSSGGSEVRQMSLAYEQRGLNLQPAGGFTGLGTSPDRTIFSRFVKGSGIGMALRRALVYGCSGRSKIIRVEPISTIFPRYMTM